MKFLTHIARLIVGCLFIFSGMVKIIDPIGFAYKLQEYFEVFKLPFLEPIALPMAVFLVLLEILLGIFLLMGAFRKFTLTCLLVLIIFFTFLTFYSAYFNVVQDCGCFGDAIPLTPWESFTKDIILTVLIVFLVINAQHITPLFKENKFKWNFIPVILVMLLGIFFAYKGLAHLPIIDFRPYSEGTHLQIEYDKLMKGVKTENFYLLKDPTGKEFEVSNEDYLKDEKLWEYELVSTRSESITDPSNQAKISPDFNITCGEEDTDLTTDMLSSEIALLVVIQQEEKLKKSDYQMIAKNLKSLDAEIKVFIASNNGTQNSLFKDYTQCMMDIKTLKAVVRSNPGYVLMKKGVVIKKWHHRDLESGKNINQILK